MPPKGLSRKFYYVLAMAVVLLVIVLSFRHRIIAIFQYQRLKALECNVNGKKQDCLSRLWAHRVNTLERYQWLSDRYAGFEVDIVFDSVSNSLLVSHGPVGKSASRLELGTFINSVNRRMDRLWLDMRKIGPQNIEQVLTALSRVENSVWVKASCIVETYDGICARAFTREGYQTSFNTWRLIPDRMDRDGNYRDSIQRLLTGVRWVSQEAKQLPLLKKWFKDKRILTWQLNFGSFVNRRPLRDLLNDDQVDIVLLNIKSPYYR